MGRLSKTVRDGFYGFFLRRAPRHVVKSELARRQIKAISSIYGEFLDGNDFSSKSAQNPTSESGFIVGELVFAIQKLALPENIILLAGERKSSKQNYSDISGIPISRIITAGLHEEMDFQWDYELSPPTEIPKVDLVVSQAMIEHLIDPYKHLRDCYNLLNPGGHLIVHTVIPGFQYHRYPVDCLRFFPDWFEEVANRLGASIALKTISTETHIVYAYRKPSAGKIDCIMS